VFRRVHIEILSSAVLTAITAFLFYSTYTFTRGTMAAQELVACLWPRMILILLGFISIVKLIRALLSPEIQDRRTAVRLLSGKSLLILEVLFLITLYTVGMKYIGFIAATFFFQIALLSLLKERNPLTLIGVPLLITVFVCVLFLALLYVPFPRGVGIFDDFTLFIYSLIGR